ncbi:MAG: hypothetical protein AABX71_02465, partial [Nanoarchaeota archaeon]
MSKEKCSICARDSSQARLVDAVYDNEVMKVCEECALLENILVIKKPSSSQIEKGKKEIGVRERMRKIAGLPPRAREVTLDDLRKQRQDVSIKTKMEMAKSKNNPINLIENYNWL